MARSAAEEEVRSVVEFAAHRARWEAETDERIRFERLVTDLTARFVNVGDGEIDGCIVEAQRQLVEALDLDRSALFQITGGKLSYTHSWARPEFEIAAEPLSMTTEADFPWFDEKLRSGEAVVVARLGDIPEPDRQVLRRFGTKSTVVVPLIVGGELVGALTFGALRAERPWPAAVVDRFRLVATVFCQALARRRAHQELQTALSEVTALRDQLARDNAVLHRDVKALRGIRHIVAESPAAQRVLMQIEQVARTGATVLLLGETGSGKEMVAQAIHDQSPRHARPMVRVSCAAIPTALMESELFGRERGAYTGALSRQAGRFELAHGSTIFLDEVGELPLESQAKLLRVLQDRVVERLGSGQPIKVDVRIIAATNRNLQEAVAARTFREDLFYRLDVFPITVPPLRERTQDIPPLVWSFVEEFGLAFGKTIEAIPKDTMEALVRYPWPGNVRELRNVIERAMIVATGPRLAIELPGSSAAAREKSLKISEVEASHIRGVLDRTGWRVRGRGGAAELLGMKPTTLEGRMAKLGIRRVAPRQ